MPIHNMVLFSPVFFLFSHIENVCWFFFFFLGGGIVIPLMQLNVPNNIVFFLYLSEEHQFFYANILNRTRFYSGYFNGITHSIYLSFISVRLTIYWIFSSDLWNNYALVIIHVCGMYHVPPEVNAKEIKYIWSENIWLSKWYCINNNNK